MNRVVITGYGVASPIGNDAQTFLESLQKGKNGIGPITKFDASETYGSFFIIWYLCCVGSYGDESVKDRGN